MRAKTEYVQEKDERSGKQIVRKIGLAPIMRDGIEYEFTTFFELDAQHMAFVGKDRTGLFDGQIFKPDAEIGHRFLTWLNSGADIEVKRNAMPDEQKAELIDSLSRARTLDELFQAFSVAYRTAIALPDPDALAELTRLKDARKALLELHDDSTYGVTA